MDYTKLVKALRCGNDGKLPCHNNECPYWVDQWHGIGLCNVIKKNDDAADAIEALQAELAISKGAIRILNYNIEQMKEDCMKLIEKEMARLKREAQEWA